jgi:hypothetical protein
VRRDPGCRVGVAAEALLDELVAVHRQIEGPAGAHVVEGGVVPVDDPDHESHGIGGDQPGVLGVPYPTGVRGRDLCHDVDLTLGVADQAKSLRGV